MKHLKLTLLVSNANITFNWQPNNILNINEIVVVFTCFSHLSGFVLRLGCNIYFLLKNNRRNFFLLFLITFSCSRWKRGFVFVQQSSHKAWLDVHKQFKKNKGWSKFCKWLACFNSSRSLLQLSECAVFILQHLFMWFVLAEENVRKMAVL